MTLVIPMSGQGKRFVAAGYERPKPLIRVDGKPIIEHVLDLYPGEEDVRFICNEDHLHTTDLGSVLERLRPGGTIIPIPTHNHGPVWAIKQAYAHIPDTEDVLISYCDFTGNWDYDQFKKTVKESGADGCIPAYIGFHPHLLGKDFYGHMRWRENTHHWMEEIQEKKSFTDDKMQEYGAVGSYWFKTGKLMKHYFDDALKHNLRTGNEFFCSMPYNALVRDGGKVLIYPMQHFCQWGTPEDLQEYDAWSRCFAALAGERKGHTDIPSGNPVRARRTSAEDQQKTFAYWQEFFSQKPWHPYSKNNQL